MANASVRQLVVVATIAAVVGVVGGGVLGATLATRSLMRELHDIDELDGSQSTDLAKLRIDEQDLAEALIKAGVVRYSMPCAPREIPCHHEAASRDR